MATWLKVIIGIVVCLAAIYLIGMIVNVVFARIFYKKIKHRKRSLNVLILQKQEMIQRIYNEIVKKNISIQSSIYEKIDNLNMNVDYFSLTNNERIELVNNLSLIVEHLTKLVNEHNIKECSEFLKCIKDVDNNFRQTVSTYNSSVVGYNYWINVFWYRYIFILLKKKPYDLLDC